MRYFNSVFVGIIMILTMVGCADHDGGVIGPVGPAGRDGSNCSVKQNADGGATVTCEDGTVVTINPGQDGEDGTDGTNGINGLDGTGCDLSPKDEYGCIMVSCGEANWTFVCDGTDGEDGLNSIQTMQVEPSGLNCREGGLKFTSGVDDNRNGRLDAGEVDSTGYACNGADGVNGTNGTNGTNGVNGEDGFNSIQVMQVEPSGANCSNGGLKFTSGVDDNRNGRLDTEEVDSTGYACNGEDGVSGTNGTNGTNGFTSIVTVVPEAPGGNCPNGGTRITAGLDDNRNGRLDSGEVDSTAYVCNGIDGAKSLIMMVPEAPGGNCANGGTKITTGVDDNRNERLDAAEVDSTAYVCNGEDGEDGPPGPQGPAGTSCSMSNVVNGCFTVTCGTKTNQVCNGTNGINGLNGTNCTMTDKVNGCFTVTCGNRSNLLCDGVDGGVGASCTVTGYPDGSAKIECSDGTEATVKPGQDGEDGEDGIDGTGCSSSKNNMGCLLVTCGVTTTTVCPEDLPDPTPPTGCQKDSDCTDGKACTDDVCDLSTGVCRYVSQVCDDGVACTFDWCDTNGYCNSTPNNSECGDDNYCVPTGYWWWYYGSSGEEMEGGCFECRWDSDCWDGDGCTVDTCNSGVCESKARNCGSGRTCVQTDYYSEYYQQYDDLYYEEYDYECRLETWCGSDTDCENGQICVWNQCWEPLNCVNTNLCLIVTPVYDSNTNTSWCGHEPKNCSDGRSDTIDACVPETGACTHTPVDVGCEFDLDCNDSISTTTDICEDNGECSHTPNVQCKTLVAEEGWAFYFSRGPKTDGEDWVPNGNWHSCDENNAENCRTMSWCGEDVVLFNLQQLPNVAGADWLLRNVRGYDPCQVDADVVLDYTPADLFVGAVPSEVGCSPFCDPNGYPNYRCTSAE